MNRFLLFMDGKNTGISVRQDTVYPEMWRVHHRDYISDMVNLSRAKDAAAVMGHERIDHHAIWKAASNAGARPPVRPPGLR